MSARLCVCVCALVQMRQHIRVEPIVARRSRKLNGALILHLHGIPSDGESHENFERCLEAPPHEDKANCKHC